MTPVIRIKELTKIYGAFTALDRLTLLSAGSDPGIAKLFAHAEQKRHFCGLRDPLLHATPKRPGDVTSSVVKPRLRGRIAR